MATDTSLQQRVALAAAAASDDDDDDEMALVRATAAVAVDDDSEDESDSDDDAAESVDLAPGGAAARSEAQASGMMVLALLDKIIGAVDRIQQSQGVLEARQEGMEKSAAAIQAELGKLGKSQVATGRAVDKMLEKVRKVNTNVKSVRGDLERQAGQIRRLEGNENELLKRRTFKLLIYQDKSVPETVSKKPVAAVGEDGVLSDAGGEEVHEGGGGERGSEEEVEIEETIEESRAERIKRSSKQRVDTIKKAFSKEKMEKTKLKTKENLEKTRQRTRENLEKTRQRTRENLEKTKHSLEKKMGKLGSKMTPNAERKVQLKGSREKLKKSLTPDHAVHARNKNATYRVPPFTFHVKKVREGAEDEDEEPREEALHVKEEKGLQSVGLVVEEGVGLLAQVKPEGVGHLAQVEVEEGELVSLDSPEMEALLGAVEDSQLVLVETERPKGKVGK